MKKPHDFFENRDMLVVTVRAKTLKLKYPKTFGV